MKGLSLILEVLEAHAQRLEKRQADLNESGESLTVEQLDAEVAATIEQLMKDCQQLKWN